MREIDAFNTGLNENDRKICECLKDIIENTLKDYSSKLYHGSPVWFIDNNPIVGYSKKTVGIALLFWSGQGFSTEGLQAIGKFKAAEKIYTSYEGIEKDIIIDWLKES